MSRIQYRAVEDVDKALMRLSTNEPNAFDFVLLDDHRQVNYLDDYELCIRLLRSGGLLVITDVGNLFFACRINKQLPTSFLLCILDEAGLTMGFMTSCLQLRRTKNA
jgi:hypothetical protein